MQARFFLLFHLWDKCFKNCGSAFGWRFVLRWNKHKHNWTFFFHLWDKCFKNFCSAFGWRYLFRWKKMQAWLYYFFHLWDKFFKNFYSAFGPRSVFRWKKNRSMIYFFFSFVGQLFKYFCSAFGWRSLFRWKKKCKHDFFFFSICGINVSKILAAPSAEGSCLDEINTSIIERKRVGKDACREIYTLTNGKNCCSDFEQQFLRFMDINLCKRVCNKKYICWQIKKIAIHILSSNSPCFVDINLWKRVQKYACGQKKYMWANGKNCCSNFEQRFHLFCGY